VSALREGVGCNPTRTLEEAIIFEKVGGRKAVRLRKERQLEG
jgi:hypothetical protein